MRSMGFVSVAAAGFVLLICGAAIAQEAGRSRWGVGGSVTPGWSAEPAVFKQLFEFDEVDFYGSDLEIGIVRGAMGRGDWGVSFVRKRISDGSRLVNDNDYCFSDSECVPFSSETYRFSSAAVHGIQVHRFVPFATIRRRAQIGMTVGGGIGGYRGQVHVDRIDGDVQFPAGAAVPSVSTTASQEMLDIKDFVEDRGRVAFLPLGRLEVTAALLASPSLKIKVGGGFNFPGTARVTVSGLYLFGDSRP